ncbi:hypothetical protein D3C87_1357830 [compost metagenome]
MPDAEDGAGHSCERREIGCRKSGTETGVLHSHLDGDCLALGEGETRRLRRKIAKQISKTVMENHDGKDHQSGLGYRTFRCADNRRNNQNDTDHADKRQRRHSRLDDVRQQLLQGGSKCQRHQNDLDDAQEHCPAINRQELAGEQPHEEGRHQGSSKRRH